MLEGLLCPAHPLLAPCPRQQGEERPWSLGGKRGQGLGARRDCRPCRNHTSLGSGSPQPSIPVLTSEPRASSVPPAQAGPSLLVGWPSPAQHSTAEPPQAGCKTHRARPGGPGPRRRSPPSRPPGSGRSRRLPWRRPPGPAGAPGSPAATCCSCTRCSSSPPRPDWQPHR